MSGQTAIRVMNKINVVIINQFFFVVFFGGPLTSLVLLTRRQIWKTRAIAILACFCLLVGEWGVTMWYNVPMNNSLATVSDADLEKMKNAQADKIWTEYSVTWTFWNTVRCVASAVATAGFAWSLRS